jgi:hypothetical protein
MLHTSQNMVHLILGFNFGFWALKLRFSKIQCHLMLFENTLNHLNSKNHAYIYDIQIIIKFIPNFKLQKVVGLINDSY